MEATKFHKIESEVPGDYESKLKLRPWLLSRIESNEVPGLEWVDPSEYSFKIPWKHHGKHDWTETDAQIFKEWAIHTGKFKEGDQADYAVWKTRLRCALHKLPDVEEVNTKYKVNNYPYRVYRFRKKPDLERARSYNESKRRRLVSHHKRDATSIVNPAVIKQLKHEFDSVGASYKQGPTSLEGFKLPPEFAPYVSEAAPYQQQLQVDNQPWTTGQQQPHHPPPPPPPTISQQYAAPSTTHFYQPNTVGNVLTNTGSMYPVSGSSDVKPMTEAGTANLALLASVSTAPVHPSAITIEVYYRETLKYSKEITSSAGAILYYGSNPPASINGAELIELTSPTDQRIGSKYVFDINFLLPALDGGIHIYATEEGNIFATRNCRSRVFCRTPDFVEPYSLSRKESRSIFNFQNFENNLQNPNVDAQTFAALSVGQKWPAGVANTAIVGSCVISIKITSKLAQIMSQSKAQGQTQTPSSIGSIEIPAAT